MTNRRRWVLTYAAIMVALALVIGLVYLTLLSEVFTASMVIEPCQVLRIFICRRITERP